MTTLSLRDLTDDLSTAWPREVTNPDKLELIAKLQFAIALDEAEVFARLDATLSLMQREHEENRIGDVVIGEAG